MKTPHKLTLPGTPGIGMHEKAPCHKPGERFLRGPIPMNWLYAASRAAGRGSGFGVAIALWYLSGLNRQARTVKLSSSVLRAMGIERDAARRGLTALQKAGLVRVVWRTGSLPIVTILNVPSPA